MPCDCGIENCPASSDKNFDYKMLNETLLILIEAGLLPQIDEKEEDKKEANPV